MDNLILPKDLKNIFTNMRSYVSDHDVGTTRDETIAKGITKIVLCKTYDEKFTNEGEHLKFYHTLNSNKDIQNL